MKKITFFILLYVVCAAVTLCAQAPAIQWNTTFGSGKTNAAFTVEQTTDSGYIVAGQSGGYGSDEFIIVKLDKNGNTQWQNSYAGTVSARSIQQTTDGGYIVAGEAVVMKLNSSGGVIWQTTLNGNAFSVQQTSDGGYIVGGGTYAGIYSENGENEDVMVVKLSSSGIISWQDSYGGSRNEFVNSIRQTSDGGYIAAGNTTSTNGEVTGTRDTVYGDFWVIRLNSTGTLLWESTFGGTDYDEANAVLQTTDGGYFVAGWSRSSNDEVTGAHGGYDYWAVKLDANHNLTWEQTYGGTSDDLAYTAVQTGDGGYVIGGTTTSDNDQVSGNHGAGDFWIIKTDSQGNLQWQAPYGGTEYETAYSLSNTNDGGYIVAGNTNSTNGQVTGNTSSNYVCWVVKLGGAAGCSCVAPSRGFASTGITLSAATLQWASSSCAVGYEVLYKTSAATAWDTLQITSNTGSETLTGLKANTTYDWMVASKCTSSPNTYSTFSAVQTFKTQSKSKALSTSSIHEAINPENDETSSLNAVIYPNPASGTLRLTIQTDESSTIVRVVSTTGQVVMEKNVNAVNGNFNQFDISKLSPGLYFICIISGNNFVSKKFIKQ